MTVLPHQLVKVDRVAVGGTNAWVVGDGEECLVIDAPPGAATDLAAVVGRRRVRGILCTHGHAGHIASALTLSDITGAEVFLHPDDYGLWHEVFPTRWPERVLLDGITFDVGTARLVGIHVPGHTDGGMCWYAEKLGAVFTGDSLGAEGAGRDLPTAQRTRLLSAVRARLFTLPPFTVIRPGHGPDGRIGTARWARDSWS